MPAPSPTTRRRGRFAAPPPTADDLRRDRLLALSAGLGAGERQFLIHLHLHAGVDGEPDDGSG